VPVLVLAAIGAGAAYTASRTVTPLYRAQGRILVLGQVEASGLGLTADQVANTDAALMTQPPALAQVAKDLNIPGGAGTIASEVQVRPEYDTEILDVIATDPDPARATRIVNTLMNDFIGSLSPQYNAQLTQQIAALDTQIAQLQTSLAADQAQLTALQARRPKPDTSVLQASIDSTTTQITQLNALATSLRSNQSHNTAPLSIVAPATVPSAPSSPDFRTNILLGALAGLLIGVALAGLYQFLDTGLRNEDDVRRRLGVPALGVIPRFSAPIAGRKRTRDQQQERAAEAYRRLRTNLLFSAVDKKLKTVVVTSARIGEGKTYTAANLAGAIAASGARVLLIDGDLRRPAQHRIFDEPLQHGFSDLLLEAGETISLPANGAFHTRFQNLSLVTAGTLPPNPSELVASKNAAPLLELFEHTQDVVVIDTPPVDVVTDAVTLSARASATVLVVEAGHTNARQAQRAIDAIRSVGGTVAGVVLNKTRRRWVGTYYYNYYYERRRPAVEAGVNGSQATWMPIGFTRAGRDATTRTRPVSPTASSRPAPPPPPSLNR
jgi:capsular exopolysaccharide synthesis family protein